MPCLSMVLSAVEHTFSVIHSPVSGMKKRLVNKFGLNQRLVFRFENETECPFFGHLPVKSQILDMMVY